MDIQALKELAVPIASAVTAIAAALATVKVALNRRTRIKDDLDILNQLDKDSEEYETLKQHIRWQIRRVSHGEQVENIIALVWVAVTAWLLITTGLVISVISRSGWLIGSGFVLTLLIVAVVSTMGYRAFRIHLRKRLESASKGR